MVDGADVEMMQNTTGFLQELVGLHGAGGPCHGEMPSTVFDVDQDILFDGSEFDYGYSL